VIPVEGISLGKIIAPVNVSPVFASLIKPLIVADFGASIAGYALKELTNNNVSNIKEILVVIQSDPFNRKARPGSKRIAKHAKIKTIYLFVVHPEIAFVSFDKGID
jgi:hypothetical protein